MRFSLDMPTRSHIVKLYLGAVQLTVENDRIEFVVLRMSLTELKMHSSA